MLKGHQNVVGNIDKIDENTEFYVKTEIGLFVDQGIKLTLAGVKYKVIVERTVDV